MASIFYFRNDLRIEDNIGFINCFHNSKKIIPIYIFENNQNENIIKNILNNLNTKINLNIFYGNPTEIISNLVKNNKNIESIYFNCEYTFTSKIRDCNIIEKIKQINENINFHIYEDYLLTNINILLNNNKKYFKNYTKFYNKIKKININQPKLINIDKSKTIFIKNNEKFNFTTTNFLINRNDLLKIVNKIDNNTKCMSELKLSIFLKYGIVSVRELFYSILTILKYKKLDNLNLINELYRREFYYYISFYDNDFIKNKDNLDLENENFIKWKNGNTGIPIVDAGIIKLNKTNIIDNRLKIILASYLVKDLNINWELGEYYFSTKLIDYDVILNNALWQYVNGFDINPSFKKLNYENQSKLYDKNCNFIKKYLPYLKDLSNSDIHKLNA